MAILMTEAMDTVMVDTDIVMEHMRIKKNSSRVSIRILLIPVTKKAILPLLTIMAKKQRIIITILINHTNMIMVTPIRKMITLTEKRINSKNNLFK
jgi:hypothetical protein